MPKGGLQQLRLVFCSPHPPATRFTTGARSCDTHLYKRGSYPFGLLAPITVLWKHLSQRPPEAVQVKPKPKGSKGKRKEREDSPEDSGRVVWVWVHPSVFEQVYLELQTAASFALEAVKKGNIAVDGKAEVEIADLREQVNVFEIMGPKSSQVIKGALKPVNEDGREAFKKVR